MSPYLKQQQKKLLAMGTSILFACVSTACTTSSTSNDVEQITVYTAVEADQLKRYQWELRKAHPELKVKWVIARYSFKVKEKLSFTFFFYFFVFAVVTIHICLYGLYTKHSQ